MLQTSPPVERKHPLDCVKPLRMSPVLTMVVPRSNLTNANHIIFLSPLLTETQYHYDASTTQAIGRARRYGQKKVVHIHRFLALKTIDVDVIQERTAKRLTTDGEGYGLKPEDEVDPDAPSLGSWMTRREKAMSDTE
jgi:hypothetical protein